MLDVLKESSDARNYALSLAAMPFAEDLKNKMAAHEVTMTKYYKQLQKMVLGLLLKT
jgi:hypothetical protein